MKIIDLLVKMANKELLPKKIKYKTTIYEFNEVTLQYYIEGRDTQYWNSLYYQFYSSDKLNDKVEIIEELDEEIE